MHHLHKRVRNLDAWDLLLLKLTASMFVVILFRLFNELTIFVNSISIWVFVVLLFAFGARPFTKYFKKMN
ncbi:MAG: hypothetical protein AABX48_00425 [Nanoarchaeota archaeon]